MNPQSQSDVNQNMPGQALTYAAINPIIGNTYFQIMPSQTGEVNDTFGTLPYTSLEAQIWALQVQSATNQANTQSSQMTGQQNVTGALTVSDSGGNVVAQISAGSLPASGAASTAQPTS